MTRKKKRQPLARNGRRPIACSDTSVLQEEIRLRLTAVDAQVAYFAAVLELRKRRVRFPVPGNPTTKDVERFLVDRRAAAATLRKALTSLTRGTK